MPGEPGGIPASASPLTAVFREHVDQRLEDPIFVLAERTGDMADRKDGADRRHYQDQAARLGGAAFGRQFRGGSASILSAGCPAMPVLRRGCGGGGTRRDQRVARPGINGTDVTVTS